MKSPALIILFFLVSGMALFPARPANGASVGLTVDPFQEPVVEIAPINADFSEQSHSCESGFRGWSLYSTPRVQGVPLPVRGPDGKSAVQLFLKADRPNGAGRMGALIQPIAFHSTFNKRIRGRISLRFDLADSIAGIRISDSSGRAILYSYAPDSSPLQIPRTVALKHNVVAAERWLNVQLPISESFQELFQRPLLPPIQIELWAGCAEGSADAAVSFADLSIERPMPEITAESFRKILLREAESQIELLREKSRMGQGNWKASRATRLLLALASGNRNYLQEYLEEARGEANRNINLFGLDRSESTRYWSEIPGDLIYAFRLTSDPLFTQALSTLAAGNIEHGLDRNLNTLRPRTLTVNGLETLWQLREGFALMKLNETLTAAGIEAKENYQELAATILDTALDQFQTATGLPKPYLVHPRGTLQEQVALGVSVGHTADLLARLLVQDGTPLGTWKAEAFLEGASSFFSDPLDSGPSLPIGAIHPQSPGVLSRIVRTDAAAAFPGLIHLGRQLEAGAFLSVAATSWETLFNCSQWDGLFASADFAPRLPTRVADILPDRPRASPSAENLLALAAMYQEEPDPHYLRQAYCIFDDLVSRLALESGGYAATNSILIRQQDPEPKIVSLQADARTDEIIQAMLAWVLAIDLKPFNTALTPAPMPNLETVDQLWFEPSQATDSPVAGFPAAGR